MTTDAQKKAINKYNEKNKVLGCKIPKDKADEVTKHYTNKNYKSANEYIKDLITKDSGIEL